MPVLLSLSFLPSDYAIVGSDSARIVILDYDRHVSSFVKIHQETFGDSGAQRIVPGQYLSYRPNGTRRHGCQGLIGITGNVLW
jgi:Mono-functional DNA-alkylating methyl methanesulfonate N-term